MNVAACSQIAAVNSKRSVKKQTDPQNLHIPTPMQA